MLKPLIAYGDKPPSSDMSVGVRFSAIILVLLACALGLCGLFCIIAVAILLAHHGRLLVGFSLALAGVAMLATFLICLRAARALQNRRLWGVNVATVCGALAAAFSGLMIFDFFHAGRQSADEYFLYPLAPIFFLLGTWLCIYLNTPRVRSSFEGRLLR